jgi:hypothetical protein
MVPQALYDLPYRPVQGEEETGCPANVFHKVSERSGDCVQRNRMFYVQQHMESLRALSTLVVGVVYDV